MASLEAVELSDTQKYIWTQPMPIRVQVNEAMQEIMDLKYVTSDQHVEFLRPLKPFNKQHQLRNIVTGITASDNVNVDMTKNNGHLKRYDW